MSLPSTPRKVLASRFAHLAYTPPKKNASAASSRLELSSSQEEDDKRPRRQRLPYDIDSDDLDGDDQPPVQADHDLRPLKVEQKDQVVPVPEPVTSEYFPSSSQLKRKLSSSSFHPTSSLISPSPKKKSSIPIARSYADPTVYEDHGVLTDLMCFEADVMFCGINPGLSSAKKGHHYAGATNRFWNCLYQSGFTPTVLSHTQDYTLPPDHNICMTNLVARPTASASELSSHLDMRPSVPALFSKILIYRPRVVCFVGKDIWKEVEFVIKKAAPSLSSKGKGKGKAALKVEAESNGEVKDPREPRTGAEWEGPRGWKIVHGKEERRVVQETYFWVVSSTSGLVRESMETRLATHWRPLRTFIRDLKAGVKPWLLPLASDPDGEAREFRKIPSLEEVQQAAVELGERYAREKGRKVERGSAAENEPDGEATEQEGSTGEWRVVEVWEPRSGKARAEG